MIFINSKVILLSDSYFFQNSLQIKLEDFSIYLQHTFQNYLDTLDNFKSQIQIQSYIQINLRITSIKQLSPKKMSNDASIQQKAEEFIKIIQVQISKRSLNGARQLLLTSYAKALLPEEKIQWLLNQIKSAQPKAQESFEKRIYWEWWIIFLITSLLAAVLIYKFGIVVKILEQFKITALAARVIIRTAVYSISTLVGGVFGYLANAIDSFCACIFGY